MPVGTWRSQQGATVSWMLYDDFAGEPFSVEASPPVRLLRRQW